MLLLIAILFALVLFVLAPEFVSQLLGVGLAVLAVAVGVVFVFMLMDGATLGEAVFVAAAAVSVVGLVAVRAKQPDLWRSLARAGRLGAVMATWLFSAGGVLVAAAALRGSHFADALGCLLMAVVFALVGEGLRRESDKDESTAAVRPSVSDPSPALELAVSGQDNASAALSSGNG